MPTLVQRSPRVRKNCVFPVFMSSRRGFRGTIRRDHLLQEPLMTQIRRVCAVVAASIVLTLAPAFAKTIALDSATIADINAAFDAGTLTAETLVQMCLARIAAVDRTGPALHAVITLNPKALDAARALDAERKAKGR